jgi:sec-independent protein translocase protein TatA
MQIGFWQILIVVLLVVLLFGRGKISDLMGDVAKGIKNFKKGMSDEDTSKANQPAEPPKVIDQTATTAAAAPATAAAAPGAAGAPAAPPANTSAMPEKKAG